MLGSMFSYEIEWLNAEKYILIYYPLLALLRAVTVTVYVLLGYIVKEKVKKYISRVNIWTNVGVVVLSMSLLLLIFKSAGNVDIHVMRMGKWYVAFVCAILGTIMVFGVSMLLDSIKGIRWLFRYMGINSMFIMATHSYLKIASIITWILQKLNLFICRYVVLLQIVLLIIVECILCKLWVPFTERVINVMIAREK